MDHRFAPPGVGVADPSGPGGPRPALLFYVVGGGVALLGLLSLLIGLMGFSRLRPGSEADLVMSSLCTVYGLAAMGAAVGVVRRRAWGCWLGGVLLLLVTAFVHIGMRFEDGLIASRQEQFVLTAVLAALWVCLLGVVGCIVQAVRHARASR